MATARATNGPLRMSVSAEDRNTPRARASRKTAAEVARASRLRPMTNDSVLS